MSSENFNWINVFLFPYLLGIKSSESRIVHDEFVVTNSTLTHYRRFGSSEWIKITQENVQVASALALETSTYISSDLLMGGIIDAESIREPVACYDIAKACLGYYLAVGTDIQPGQLHYGLCLSDPLLGMRQTVNYLFPKTNQDLYNLLPVKEFNTPRPMTAGSLGGLSSLDLSITLDGIAKAKSRFENTK